MKPRVLLPWLQDHTSWFLSRARRMHFTWPLSCFSKCYFNIIFPSLHVFSALYPSGFPSKILYTFPLFTMQATCPGLLIMFDLMSLIMFHNEYNFEALECVLFVASCCFLRVFKSKYFPQHPLLEHSQSVPFSQWKKSSTTFIQYMRQNCGFVYLDIYVFG